MVIDVAAEVRRSDEGRQRYHEHRAKFDYFVAGLSGVLTAYLGESVHLGKAGINQQTFALAAVLCLSIGTVTAIERIRWMLRQREVEAQKLNSSAIMMTMLEAASANKTVVHPTTGALLTPEQAKEEGGTQLFETRQAEKERVRVKGRADRYRNASIALLYAGMILLAASKLLGAIRLTPSPADAELQAVPVATTMR